MENVSAALELLGEDNVKRLKDGITDMLLNQAEIDIESKYKYDYIIDFDEIMDEVQKEVRQEIKEKLKATYMTRFEEVADKFFSEMESN